MPLDLEVNIPWRHIQSMNSVVGESVESSDIYRDNTTLILILTNTTESYWHR